LERANLVASNLALQIDSSKYYPNVGINRNNVRIFNSAKSSRKTERRAVPLQQHRSKKPLVIVAARWQLLTTLKALTGVEYSKLTVFRSKVMRRSTTLPADGCSSTTRPTVYNSRILLGEMFSSISSSSFDQSILTSTESMQQI